MGFPVEMFPVLFAIPRTAGWLAQWDEMLLDPEQKIARPRQIYTGYRRARLRRRRDAAVARLSAGRVGRLRPRRAPISSRISASVSTARGPLGLLEDAIDQLPRSRSGRASRSQ